MLRYEDMKHDTATALVTVLAFLDRCAFRALDSSAEKLQRTIDLSSPEKMRALEKEEAGRWVLTKGTRSDKPFVRSSIRGMEVATGPESVDAIESAWGA